jgi:formylglycine-generating enzyme required for sulfatase activity
VLDGIKRAARDWRANGKAASYLVHAEERLRAAERLLTRPDLAADLEPTDKDYIISCQRAEQAARSRMRRVQAFVGALVALLAMGGVGWWKQNFIREQYIWRVAMGPSVLTVNKEKANALNPGTEFKECAAGCPTMVVLPAGKFTMGSPDNEKDRSDSEGPQHEVVIAKPFAVSKTEVTFAEWDACAVAGGCPKASDSTWGRGDRPVINVSWDDAKQYADWLSKMTGKKYRLLTEAEWEYAARAGSQTRFSFGDDEAQLEQYAWYIRNSEKRTQPVGDKIANAFRLHDMHGNVYEWVEDFWHDSYRGAPTDGSAWTKDGNESQRVVRGGSWGNSPRLLRAAYRSSDSPDIRDNDRGFRLARTLSY